MSKIRFVGLDVHADTIAVAVAEPSGEVRSFGIIANRPESIGKLMHKLGRCEWRPRRSTRRLITLIFAGRNRMLMIRRESVSPVVFLRHLPSVSSPSALTVESSCPTTFDSRLGTGCSSHPARSLRPSAHRFLLLPCCSSPFCRLPELLAVKYSTVLPCPLSSSHLWLAQRTWLH